MDFYKLEQKLLESYDNIKQIHDLLKESTGAKAVDILFFDSDNNMFFDQINKINISVDFLDPNSVIGCVCKNITPYFNPDICSDRKYNLAIDNPFKIEMVNQVLLPTVKNGQVIDIVRLSHLPLSFDKEDFNKLVSIQRAFDKIFSIEYDMSKIMEINNDVFIDRFSIFSSIKEIRKHFDVLMKNAKNQEVEKLINQGKDNITHIHTYLNPSLEKVSKIKKEMRDAQAKIDGTRNLTVLIADDIKINVHILKAMLNDCKIIGKVHLAYDGLETQEVLENNNSEERGIDILFLDHHMPGKLGTQIAQELKNNPVKNEKIIIVSITNDTNILEQYKHLYDYHITKPFSKDNIVHVMSRIKEEKLAKL